MAATRQARAKWNGDLATGSGEVSSVTSGKFSSLPVSWGARTEAPQGKTSPEELLAAAHASCFSMALAAGLAKGGTPPNEGAKDGCPISRALMNNVKLSVKATLAP